MGWLRLDDAFGDHPKVIGLSDRAFRAHVMGLLYCARHLTDGVVPRAAAPKAAAVRELERAGLWTSTRGGGWLIHDYLDFNPSKADVLADREERREQRVAAGKARAAGAQRTAGRFAPAGDQQTTSEPLAKSLATRTSPDPTPTPTPKTLASDKPTRPRDELFEALADVEGADLTALTRSARGSLNDAAKQLRDIGATAEDVKAGARFYRLAHPTWPLTAQALVKHWPTLNGSATPARPTPDNGLDDSWLFEGAEDA